jgi:hypothetical protein
MLAPPPGHAAIVEVAPVTHPLKLRHSPLDIIRRKQQVAVEVAPNSGARIQPSCDRGPLQQQRPHPSGLEAVRDLNQRDVQPQPRAERLQPKQIHPPPLAPRNTQLAAHHPTDRATPLRCSRRAGRTRREPADGADDRRGAQESGPVRLVERQAPPFTTRRASTRASRPLVARAARDQARRSGGFCRSAGARARRHRGRDRVRDRRPRAPCRCLETADRQALDTRRKEKVRSARSLFSQGPRKEVLCGGRSCFECVG